MAHKGRPDGWHEELEAAGCPPGRRNGCRRDATVKGFGLVGWANGARTYVQQHRLGGRDALTRRYTIGRHGSGWPPNTARERALDVLQLVRTGVDPIDSECDARARRRAEGRGRGTLRLRRSRRRVHRATREDERAAQPQGH